MHRLTLAAPSQPANALHPLRAWARAGSALLMLMVLPLVAACGGGEDKDAPPRYPTRVPAAVAPVSVVPDPVTEEEAAEEGQADEVEQEAEEGSAEESEVDAAAAATGPAMLPDNSDAAIIQFARIEPSPWEPAIQAQMVPHFSMQANGRGFFSTPGGPSEDGWYQTAISPNDAERFLQRLVDDIGVLELAATHGEGTVGFETPPNGDAPTCPGSDQVAATGVVYVKTADREGRFVFSQCDLVDPTGPDANRLLELQQVLNLVQIWKRGVFTEFAAEQITATTSLLGWWSDLRQPYTPESAVAFGTRARGGIPAGARVATWPLTTPLIDSFDADYGASPVERRYTQPDSVSLVREARAALGSTHGPRFWGPLWRDGSGSSYFVGLRPSVPGGNHVVIDYEYQLPRRGIGAGR